MRRVGKRVEPTVQVKTNGASLASNIAFSADMTQLAGGWVSPPKGVYRYKSHDEANAHQSGCLAEVWLSSRRSVASGPYQCTIQRDFPRSPQSVEILSMNKSEGAVREPDWVLTAAIASFSYESKQTFAEAITMAKELYLVWPNIGLCEAVRCFFAPDGNVTESIICEMLDLPSVDRHPNIKPFAIDDCVRQVMETSNP